MSARASRRGIAFHHPWAFWTGVAAVTAGVVLHLPMFFGARDAGYMLAGMPMGLEMKIGMALIVAGVIGTAYGLFPRGGATADEHVAGLRVRALDDAKITKAHVALLLVMAAAITIDVMKPVTLGFVAPGAAFEYGLRSPLNPGASVPVALYPLAGIIGTVIGSVLWGWLGDRMGRRASILLSAVLFIATSICGSMPAFEWNLVMCFLMGIGVGGMLPIAFALMAETMPARHRSWLMVLIGGDVAGAYLVTALLASWLEPIFGWRILWLIGLPTGVLLVLLNRWIPESPRFLLQHGREAEARAVMERYGAAIVETDRSELEVEEGVRGRYAQLFAAPFAGLTWVVVLLGLAVGLVTFGFQLWIPSNLRALGFDEAASSRTLFWAAVLGFPATFAVAFLYGFWSSKKTLIALSGLTVVALAGFVVLGDGIVDHERLLPILLIMPITGISSLQAVLTAYGSEVYPTRIRSRGAGLAAGATKFGGVALIALVAMAVAPPTIVWTAVIGAVPLLVGTLLVFRWGIETRKRRLEDITAEELRATPEGVVAGEAPDPAMPVPGGGAGE